MATMMTISKTELENALAFADNKDYTLITLKGTPTHAGVKLEVANGDTLKDFVDITDYGQW